MDYRTGNIDLHIHSSASDGSLSPEQILHQALNCGLAAISITDHDTVEGTEAALAHGIPENLEFVTGVEISAEFPPEYDVSGSMHILGYGITVDEPMLNRMLEKQQAARSNRNPKIIQKLNSLGIKVSLEEIEAETGKNEIARPHIAACLVRKGYAANVDEAFDRYLGRGGPAYVNKFRVPAKEAIETIDAAGGIAVLAHPGLLREPAANRLENLVSMLADMGLGGIEAYYPGHDQKQTELYEKIAEKFELLVTGGTDFHGDINPEISMGSGTGDLAVPYSVFQKLEETLAVKKPKTEPGTINK
ncbi:MAG: PHP domain-containing protein [Desulfobacteraceae bacterium]|nr:PHP domain-containing protein [Desulfobacteraceae bacterium]